MRALLFIAGCSLLAAGGAFVYRNLKGSIMATRQEVLDSLAATNQTLDKVASETAQLVQDVADLREQLENADNIPDEILDAARSLETRVKSIDDLVADEEPTPEQPQG